MIRSGNLRRGIMAVLVTGSLLLVSVAGHDSHGPFVVAAATKSATPAVSATPAAPGREQISAANSSRLAEWTMLGQGDNEMLAWSSDGTRLAICSSAGIWLYSAERPDL